MQERCLALNPTLCAPTVLLLPVPGTGLRPGGGDGSIEGSGQLRFTAEMPEAVRCLSGHDAVRRLTSRMPDQ
jgi:hypothetical protein